MAKAVHPMSSMRAAVAFAVLAALTSCKKKEEAAASKAPPPPPVKVALVVAQEVPSPDALTLTGTLAADQRSEVTADTQGKVVAVLVERGQRVKMGQPVVRLDVRTAALSAREAQANLEAARAQKQLAEEECKRTQTLLDKGAITRSEYDRQATQCTSTLQQVSAAQARADMITKSISDGLVRAPFDGQVTEKSVAPGEWVAPGRTLFTLVDDDPLRIELSVPEIAVRAIKQGQKVAISAVAQPEKTYSATVSRIGGEIGKSRSLIVEATLDPQTELVPGMFARATIVVGQVARPVLPKDAVIKHGKQWHAFVAVKREGANDTELEDRIVQVGPAASPDQVAILQGLAPGDRVVAKPTADLSDGTKIVDTDGPKPQAAKAEPTKAEATKAPAPKAK